MFLRPSSESFTVQNTADCPYEGDEPTMEEPHSFAQEQLEILESKEEDTHLKRFVEGSKKEMKQSMEQVETFY